MHAWDGGVAVVTNVGLDHQEYLGDTIELIAKEKALGEEVVGSLSPGQAHLALAPNLACHAGIVAERAFDAMRQVLPDTDLYIGALHD